MSTIERQCVLSQLPEIIALKKHYDTVITNKSTYFKVNEGIARGRVVIKGEEKVNYSTYNYLGLTADERVIKFTEEAIEKHGTSVSGSRILTGEIQLHRMLEREIADVLGEEAGVAVAMAELEQHADAEITLGAFNPIARLKRRAGKMPFAQRG